MQAMSAAGTPVHATLLLCCMLQEPCQSQGMLLADHTHLGRDKAFKGSPVRLTLGKDGAPTQASLQADRRAAGSQGHSRRRRKSTTLRLAGCTLSPLAAVGRHSAVYCFAEQPSKEEIGVHATSQCACRQGTLHVRAATQSWRQADHWSKAGNAVRAVQLPTQRSCVVAPCT